LLPPRDVWEEEETEKGLLIIILNNCEIEKKIDLKPSIPQHPMGSKVKELLIFNWDIFMAREMQLLLEKEDVIIPEYQKQKSKQNHKTSYKKTWIQTFKPISYIYSLQINSL